MAVLVLQHLIVSHVEKDTHLMWTVMAALVMLLILLFRHCHMPDFVEHMFYLPRFLRPDPAMYFSALLLVRQTLFILK